MPVSGATRVYCLAHIRRYFHNIIVDLDKEALKNSRAIIGFNYCEQIYKLEKELRETHSNKALDYAKKNLPGLKNVLLDGSLEVDNNAAERAIKPFVIGRKNFLFANTAKGATASSNIYSIVETAKANNLVVERYLVYLFDNLSRIDISDSENLENLMPWSNKIPENMKIKDKK
nr:transposase [Clostridium cochlearium]